MASIKIHPSEFAYAFAYAKAKDIVGWGYEPFSPTFDDADIPTEWFSDGEARMIAAGRLIGTSEEGMNFTDELSSAILALVKPSLVLMAERRSGDEVQRLTVHVAGSDLIGLTLGVDGLFELVRYTEMTAAAGACVGFLGASLTPLFEESRIDTDMKTLTTLHKFSGSSPEKAQKALVLLGLSESAAISAVNTLAEPQSSGMLSVLYCADNEVQDAEAISVLTSVQDHTWILFQPASVDGPMILERSAASALTARVSVGIAARLG